MREKLLKYEDKRELFTGIVTKFGMRHGSDTILLQCITDYKGNVLCEHAWIDASRSMMHLTWGSKISFTAVVKRYRSLHGENFGLQEVQGVLEVGHVRHIPAMTA